MAKEKKKKKTHYGYFSSRNRLEKEEKEKNKNCLSVPFQPDGKYKIPKKVKKNKKIKK